MAGEVQFYGEQAEPVPMPECSCCEHCDPNTMPAGIYVLLADVAEITAEPAIFNKRHLFHRVTGADSCLYRKEITFGGTWTLEIELTSGGPVLTISGDDDAVFSGTYSVAGNCSSIVGELALDSETSNTLDFSEATAEITKVFGNSNFCCETTNLVLFEDDKVAMAEECCCEPTGECTEIICGDGGGQLDQTYQITVAGGLFAGVYEIEFCASEASTTARCWWIVWPLAISECINDGAIGMQVTGGPGVLFIDVIFYRNVTGVSGSQPCTVGGTPDIAFIGGATTCADIDGLVLTFRSLYSDFCSDYSDTISVTINALGGGVA